MQADTQLPSAPPLPGADLVDRLNAIIETLGTNFAGPDDPAAFAWPFATWADTGNMLLKRRNAANTAWATLGPLLDFHYARGNILAAVSQAAGVPTGGLWQSIINANGHALRNAAGWQICRWRTQQQVTDTAYPSISGMFYNSDPCTGTYPAEFSSAPHVVAIASRENGTGLLRITGSEVGSGTTTTTPQYRGLSASSTDVIAFHYIAVGRWFEV